LEHLPPAFFQVSIRGLSLKLLFGHPGYAQELIKAVEKAGTIYFYSHFAHSIHAPYWWLKCLVGPTRDDSWMVNLYKRFLTWDIMDKPWITRFVDRLLNPLMGKSVVLYFTKN